jgi:hypothetical protein
MFLSLTRLRLRRWRTFFAFMPVSQRCIDQAVADPACFGVATYAGPGFTFWTATLWRTEHDMKQYLGSGAHRVAMPLLREWCSEAATAAYVDAEGLPSCAEMLEMLSARAKFVGVREPTALQSSRVVSPRKPWLRRVFKEES